jgi:hypothetical protein
MCLALGCLPSDLDGMDEQTYQLFRRFMVLERDSEKLKGLQKQFYG